MQKHQYEIQPILIIIDNSKVNRIFYIIFKNTDF